LYSFSGSSDGGIPFAGLVSDSAGTLYGTTEEGGNKNCTIYPGNGCGTVYELTPPTTTNGTWTETVLYRFSGSDGAVPAAGLIADGTGTLYGTTEFGGNSNVVCVNGYSCGTVFKLTPPGTSGGTWTETVLYSFSGSDGEFPLAGLIFGKDGALYGTTYSGGNTSCNASISETRGCGTVFKLTPPTTAEGTWTETVLHSFNGSDGAYPYAGLTMDASGALYGTTAGGGDPYCIGGCGTVFKLTPRTNKGGTWTETGSLSTGAETGCL
jgi:uncharacterized repeat protein (TIGR03803 family)